MCLNTQGPLQNPLFIDFLKTRISELLAGSFGICLSTFVASRRAEKGVTFSQCLEVKERTSLGSGGDGLGFRPPRVPLGTPRTEEDEMNS